MEQNQIEQPQVAPVKPEAEDGKMSKKGVIGMVIMTIIALAGVAFGVFGMTQSTEKDKQISDLKVQIKEISGKVTEFTTDEIVSTDEDGTVTEITDTNVVADSKDYVYIGKWGLKVKVPENLAPVSYAYFDQIGGTLCINAAKHDGQQYGPDFVDMNKNPKMGCIVRVYKNDSRIKQDWWPENAKEENAFLNEGDYYWYYEHPQAVYSQDDSEKKWEVNSVEYIQEIFTNPDNYSKI